MRAIGDRLKTLADAERYGAFALRDAIEMDDAAWAELREKPEVGATARGARASAWPPTASTSLESLEQRDAGARRRARDQGGRADRARARGADRPQGEPGDLRGDVAARPRARRSERLQARGGAVAGGVAARAVCLDGCEAGFAAAVILPADERSASLPRRFAARWCNGSTTGSGPVSRGSNPCRAASRIFVALSSRGLGQVVLSHQTGVRIPVALPHLRGLKSVIWLQAIRTAAISWCSQGIRSRNNVRILAAQANRCRW